MTDGEMSETMDALAMMLDSYKRLQSKLPTHELISLIKLTQEGQGCTFTPEFKKRFIKKGDRNANIYGRFHEELENAYYSRS